MLRRTAKKKYSSDLFWKTNFAKNNYYNSKFRNPSKQCLPKAGGKRKKKKKSVKGPEITAFSWPDNVVPQTPHAGMVQLLLI